MIALCWSRHVHAVGVPICAVVARAGRSVVTACRGRWEPSPLDLIVWDAPADPRLRCGGCERVLNLDAIPEPRDDAPTGETIVVDVGHAATQRASVEDVSDPTWVGEGPRLARERLARRGTR